VARAGENIVIRVCDDGVAFDPSAAPQVDVEQPLEERRVGGLGIHLVRQFVEQLEYRRLEGRNDLKLRV
jgi:anti-sigma regulatory factor (Ser/Thr protein kinase)